MAVKETAKPGRMNPTQMHRRNLFCQPIHVDWSEAGYVDIDPNGRVELVGANWDALTAGERARVVDEAFGDRLPDDPEPESFEISEAFLDTGTLVGEPVMNYAYPIDTRVEPEDAQAILYARGGAVCIIMLDDKPHLALTGGGMDLTEDIAEAYMLLGELPPLHFCHLPRMAEDWTPRKKWVLSGCHATISAVIAHCKDEKTYLQRYRTFYREREYGKEGWAKRTEVCSEHPETVTFNDDGTAICGRCFVKGRK
jgi:hypothetical protein